MPSFSQTWEFRKEKNGISVYTRLEPGQTIRSYRGVTTMHAPAARVFAMIEDVNHTDWWDKNLTGIKVLQYEKNKSARYYLVYDLPWPVTDRDLCVAVTCTYDPATGAGTVAAGPLPSLVPEKEKIIRIRNYHQVWTVKPLGPDRCHVELEGHVDPAGSIPDWLSNMIIVDSPLTIMGNVKERMEKL